MSLLEDSFYVTLPSNTRHPSRSNSAGHYCIQLPQELDFRQGSWQVALVEVDIPLSWYNISENPPSERVITHWRHYFKLKSAKRPVVTSAQIRIPFAARKKSYSIPYGNYDHIDVLIREINVCLKYFDTVKFPDYDNFIRHSHISINKQNLKPILHVAPGDKITLSQTLASILNLDSCGGKLADDGISLVFGGKPLYYGTEGRNPEIGPVLWQRYEMIRKQNVKYKVYRACGVPNIATHSKTLFIYSSLCSFEITGNTYTQLLRTVRGAGEFGDHLKSIFINPFYKKVSAQKVKEIEIKICDDQFRVIDFQYGKVMLVVHFRRET